MANQLDVRNVSAFIFDLDGVIWRGDVAIGGVPEAIARLKAAGKACLYCTNNAAKTPADYVEKLAGMGIEATEDEIMTSSVATALYLSSQLTGQFSAYVVGEEGLVTALRKTGARVVTMHGMTEAGDLVIENTAFPVDCVIAGIDRDFSYEKLRLAQAFILGGARFIATNRDATYPVADGVVPGAGSIVSAIETASGTAPLTIGKPQALMPILLMQKFNLNKDTTVFVGDRLETDMVAAHRADLKAIWVETGVATRDVAEKAKGQQKPDALYRDVAALADDVLAEGADVATPVPVAVGSNDMLPTVEEMPAAVAADLNDKTPSVAKIAESNGHAAKPAAPAPAAAAKPAPAPKAPTPAAPADDDDAFSFESSLNENAVGPDDVVLDPAPSPFGFSLDDLPSKAPKPGAPAASKPEDTPAAQQFSTPQFTPPTLTTPTSAPIVPGDQKSANVEEPLDNWWESIEDAFKKK